MCRKGSGLLQQKNKFRNGVTNQASGWDTIIKAPGSDDEVITTFRELRQPDDVGR